MSSVTISLKDLAAKLGGLAESEIPKLKTAIIRGAVRSIPDLVAASPIDTGLYAQSWDVMYTDLEVTIGNYAPHAANIEFGARPFTPPIGPLLEWAKRVLQDPSQPPDYSNEVWGLARGVQKKIASTGMPPRNILGNMTGKIIENMRKEIPKSGD